jgi:uncharacterized membrane protein
MKTRIARGLSLCCYLGLIGFVMLWIITLGEVAREHISIWLLLFVTPLLLPLRGVLAGRDKALIWGTLVVLIYFVHGGVVAWSDPQQRALGLIESALALTYLISASFFVRWRAEARQAA